MSQGVVEGVVEGIMEGVVEGAMEGVVEGVMDVAGIVGFAGQINIYCVDRFRRWWLRRFADDSKRLLSCEGVIRLQR